MQWRRLLRAGCPRHPKRKENEPQLRVTHQRWGRPEPQAPPAGDCADTAKGGLNLALRNESSPPNLKNDLEGDQRNLVDLAKEFEGPEIRVLRNEAVHAFTQDSLHERPNEAGTLEALGHRLPFTPPHSPKFQPIELFWWDSKNFAASQWTTGRAPQQVAADA